MLELRPNCEWCDCDLPPESDQAFICSYECTFCRSCVDLHLMNVCPTCGGGFCQRPIRPRRSWRSEKKLGLDYHPASKQRQSLAYSRDDIAAHVARIRNMPPEER